MPPPYREQRRKALGSLRVLFDRSETVRVIHYSCETFHGRQTGGSPRITSIAVRRLDSGQTKSFSISQVAEVQGLTTGLKPHYDRLERQMLDEYFEYINSAGEAKYMHWNMRDSNYGFAAIEHRYGVLGETPISIPEHRRYDLSKILLDIYGTDYITHPRLKQLAEKNSITTNQFLSGADEAARFDLEDYAALQQSTLRKVDVIADIAERAFHETLRTNSNWLVQNGGDLRGAWDWLVENKSISFLLAILGAGVGALIDHLAFHG
jgi:hypothetical protein